MGNKMSRIKSAVILCGGESKRAGFDKQLLRINNDIIAINTARKLEKAFDEIIIVTKKPSLYKNTDYKIVTDIVQDFGPLGGIYTGLYYSTSHYAYITACDMPIVNLPYIEWMRKTVMESESEIDILVTLLEEHIETFNSFYSKRVMPAIEKAVDENRRKVLSIFNDVNVYYIKEKDARLFSPDWSMFVNLNTKHDIEGFFSTQNAD